MAGKIINTCVVLHNLCVNTDRDYCTLTYENEEPVDEIFINNDADTTYIRGSNVRNSLLEHVL